MLWVLPWVIRAFVFVGAQVTRKNLVRAAYWMAKQISQKAMEEHLAAREAAQCQQAFFCGPGVEYYY